MIYLQSNKEKTRPHHFDVACAMYGAIDNVQDYKFITFEELQSGRFDNLIKSNLFVGSVEFMREVFSRIGLNDVRVPRNSNRQHKVLKLGDVKKMAKEGHKMFIKPFEIKLFTGFVIDESIYTSIANIDDDVEVMVYDVFDSQIESEWRCYIHMNRIKDIRNYSGDFFKVPSESYIESIISENRKDFPISYTIDIGVLESRENVVIEFNDMWAIGNYGMENSDYISLLRQRYFEIIRQN